MLLRNPTCCLALTALIVSGCQLPPQRAILGISAIPSKTSSQPSPISDVEAENRLAEVSNLSGTALNGNAPLSGAGIEARDLLSGRLLGGTTTNDRGDFVLSFSKSDSLKLIQVIAEKNGVTVQSLVAIEKAGQGNFLTLALGNPSHIHLDWNSSVIAKALGLKLAEIITAEGDIDQNTKTIIQRSKTLIDGLRADTKNGDSAASLTLALKSDEFQTQIKAIVQDANRAIIDAFKKGTGPIFEPQPVVLPEANLEVAGPKIEVDKNSLTVRITLANVTEQFPVSAAILESSKSVDLKAIAQSLRDPRSSGSVASDATAGERQASRSNRGSGGGTSGGSVSGPPKDDTKHGMAISEVLLADSQKSIVGSQAPAFLSYSPEGQPIKLLLKGLLHANHPPQVDANDYALTGFPFAGLLQQTFADSKPLRRVLLDDSVFLPLVDGAPVSRTQLTVSLNPKALPDLAISGLHKLSVIDREDEASIDILVSNPDQQIVPDPFASEPSEFPDEPSPVPLAQRLQPVITSVGIVEGVKFSSHAKSKEKDQENDQDASPDPEATGDNGKHLGQEKNKHASFVLLQDSAPIEEGHDEDGKYLKVEGYNLPVSIYSHYVKLNGKRLFAHATWITDEPQPRSILYVHLPDDLVIESQGNNTLVYASPLGFKFLFF